MAITRRSVWLQSTKRPPSARSPAPTMICAITSTFPARSKTKRPANGHLRRATIWIRADADPRYGIEVYFNGVLVQTQISSFACANWIRITRPPQFSLASVNAQVGPGFDNIVSLKGINYNGDGGGNWMGIDYIQLNAHRNRPTRRRSRGPSAGR